MKEGAIGEACTAQTLLGKSEEMRPLGKPMQRQENNIKIDLKEQDVKKCIGFIGLMRSFG
jgi:hypothetical protein